MAKMTLRIQIASDLHLEFYGTSNVPDDIIVPKAPVLALLGDIGLACTDQLKDFLHQQASRFETVLFVVGNHEFYNYNRGTLQPRTVEEQVEWIQQVCSERENLHFLEKQAVEINGVRILGTALWSNIPPEKVGMAEHPKHGMNDYNLSFMKTSSSNTLRKLRVADTRQWHKDSAAWLEREIAASGKRPILVLTHHTPLLTGTSALKYIGSDSQCCFSSDLAYLLRAPVRAWCCGHTHYNFDFVVNDTTRLVSNQKGYVRDNSKGYNNSFVLELDGGII